MLKIMMLPYSPAIGGFDDTDIRSFLRDKEVVSIRDYFLIKHETPYLVFALTYFLNRLDVPLAPAREQAVKRDEQVREILNESDLGLYNILREWRMEQSKKEGVPPYILFTNKTLALIVKKRPQSASELNAIEGIRKAKVEKYGAELLTRVQVPSEMKSN